jgi:hypothetical protein
MASTSKSKSRFPLTNFIVNMMGATNEQLRKAAEDPSKMAKHYGIDTGHCCGYLNIELNIRGIYDARAEKND